MDPNQPQQQQHIQIKASDEKMAGHYANLMNILATKEEFVMDFLSVFPPTGTLNARIIVSPEHFKRIVRVLQENLKRHEEQYGTIEEATAPASGIGFQER